MMKSVVYLGQKIDSCGISPVEEKVKAVHQAPDPTNVTELKSYFGQLTYYNRFLPYLAATLAPMYQLLKPNVAWKWNKEREDALEASKRLLTSTKVLTHIDLAEDCVSINMSSLTFQIPPSKAVPCFPSLVSTYAMRRINR